MSRNWLVMLVIVLGAFLVLILRLRKAKPRYNIDLLASPYGKYAKWIEAQARHETNDYTSNLAVNHNNIFGMKQAVIRKQLGSPAPNGYQKYSSVGESVRDLILWFDYTKFPKDIKSIEDYVNELKRRSYFEDTQSNYLKGMERFL